MNLLTKVAKAIGPAEASVISGWSSVTKCQTYAALILGLRPDISIEVGVWHGRGAISMALAHKEIGHGMVYAIDPWESAASAEGQINPADKEFWGNQNNHDDAFGRFHKHVMANEVQNLIKVVRGRSLSFQPPDNVGFLVLDGNHGETAIFDAKHYCPKVRTGGVLYFDDLDWTGGAVRKAYEAAKKMGFVDLYKFETGVFMQRL